MYYQVKEGSINHQPMIGSRPFKVGVTIISVSCLVFMFIVASTVSSPILHGTNAAQSTSLASIPSTLRMPQSTKVVRPAPGFLRFPQIAKGQSSVPPMGRGSVKASASVPDQPISISPTKMTPRRSMVKGFAAALALALGAGSTKAAETVDPKDLPPKIKMLQMISNWDTDKDGRISRPEFEKGMIDYVPHELSPAQLDSAWSRIVNAEKDIRANDPSYRGNTLTLEQKQLPRPGQPIPLATNREQSNIPKADGGFFMYPSEQQAYNAMLRKGKDPDVYRAKDFINTHNDMNERGWNQVLKYESVTHPECKDVKLKRFSGDYAGRPDGSFDRHHWLISRCGKEEATYVLDYFDKKKIDTSTMPYSNDEIEIRVFPDPEDPTSKRDTRKFQNAMGKSFTSTADGDIPYKPALS